METGLVNLRAELHKKRLEASKYKGKPERSKKLVLTNDRTNAGVLNRAAKDYRESELDASEAEVNDNAKRILEEKVALYEKLKEGTDVLGNDDLNERFLVDFQKKIIDEVKVAKKNRAAEQVNKVFKEDEEHWVDYTDYLGRTRTCLVQDLDKMKQIDLQMNPNAPLTEEESQVNMKNEAHRLWQVQEEQNALKKDTHYQDVTFSEARSHGVGYMQFSRDTSERKVQMDLLQELHTEAQTGQKEMANQTAKKEKAMQQRLMKVRQRKRLKMGLPMKETEEDRLKTPPPSDEEEEEHAIPVIPIAKPTQGGDNLMVKQKVREWDVGKSSQELWLDRQRHERVSEFAPPLAYSGKPTKMEWNHPKSATKTDIPPRKEYSSPKRDRICHNEHSTSENDSRRNELVAGPSYCQVAPPSFFEFYNLGNHSHGKRVKGMGGRDIEEAVAKGIAHLRSMSDI